MGVYVYSIMTKPLLTDVWNLPGVDGAGEVYGSKYAYKPYWTNFEADKWNAKAHFNTGCVARDAAWRKRLKKGGDYYFISIDDVEGVYETLMEYGKIPVYKVKGGSYYDEALGWENGPHPVVGWLVASAGGYAFFEPDYAGGEG